MVLRLVTGSLAAALLVLVPLGLDPDRTPQAGAASTAPSAKVRGGKTYVCLVRYQDGSFPELCYLEAGTADIEVLTLDKQPKRDPAWSPDGTRLAFVRGAPGDGDIISWNFWRHLHCPEGGGPCRIFGPQRRVASGSEPDWSPNGTQIAFVSRRSGSADVYVVRDTGGAARRLTTSTNDETQPDWSPNGRIIAFTRGSTIHLVNVDGSGDRVFGAGGNASWAPNGARLAFELGGDIWLANANGSGRTNLTSTPTVTETGPSWSADGGAVTFAARWSDGTEAIHTRHLGGGLGRFIVNGDQERPFVQAGVDWQHVRVLVLRVSDRRPIVSVTDARGRQVKTLRAGLYAIAFVDRSKRHGISSPLGGTSTLFVGRRWPTLEDRLTSVRPGLHSYWCPAHPRERGSYRVFQRP